MQPRIFFPDLREGEFELDEENSRHLAKVLRARPGDSLTLFNGQGIEAQAVIIQTPKGLVRVKAQQGRTIHRESPVHITVVQALCTGDKMDWVVQKATELGASAIIPVSADRSVLKLDAERAEKRGAHWRAIAQSASAQCGRNVMPVISNVLAIDQAIANWRASAAPKTGWLLDPFASQTLSSAELSGPLTFMIGPEAGWSDKEEALARAAGFNGIRCGPRILRTETAAAAVLCAVALRLGEF